MSQTPVVKSSRMTSTVACLERPSSVMPQARWTEVKQEERAISWIFLIALPRPSLSQSSANTKGFETHVTRHPLEMSTRRYQRISCCILRKLCAYLFVDDSFLVRPTDLDPSPANHGITSQNLPELRNGWQHVHLIYIHLLIVSRYNENISCSGP